MRNSVTEEKKGLEWRVTGYENMELMKMGTH